MKKIFRRMNIGLILAAVIALGAVAGLAQDPCADVEAMNKAQDDFDVLYKQGAANFDARARAIQSGKEFLEKYSACPPAQVRVDWLKLNIPKMEERLIRDRIAKEEKDLVVRFDGALRSKNWDEAFAAGKVILSKYPDKYRPAEIALATLGGDEAFKNNFKYNDDALKYAKQSIADLEANKPFVLKNEKGEDVTRLGISEKGAYDFEFRTKEDALGWMNMYIGYITSVAQKNKSAALPYLYKSTLGNTEASKQPTAFELIGGYYFDELNKIIEQIQIKSKDQKDTDTPEVAQKKVDELKALVAMSNGTAERAMDAFARAATLAKDATYKAKMKKNVEDAYKVRFGNTTGVDAWIANAVKAPFTNPTTPIQPISDPEPAKTTDGTGAGGGNGTNTGTPTGTGIGTPSATATTAAPKPATTTTTTTTTAKPKTVVKKPVKKRGAK